MILGDTCTHCGERRACEQVLICVVLQANGTDTKRLGMFFEASLFDIRGTQRASEGQTRVVELLQSPRAFR